MFCGNDLNCSGDEATYIWREKASEFAVDLQCNAANQLYLIRHFAQ